MRWSPKAEKALETFLQGEDAERRESMRYRAIEEAERYAESCRMKEVGYDQLVIGYIRATPSARRMGLRSVLQFKGVMVDRYNDHFLGP